MKLALQDSLDIVIQDMFVLVVLVLQHHQVPSTLILIQQVIMDLVQLVIIVLMVQVTQENVFLVLIKMKQANLNVKTVQKAITVQLLDFQHLQELVPLDFIVLVLQYMKSLMTIQLVGFVQQAITVFLD